MGSRFDVRHLVKRFVGSVRPGGPPPADLEWVRGVLLDGELQLWQRMYGPDQRHSVQVARDVERRLGHEATRPVLAAALLHDVGKIDSGLRTFGRVVATLTIALVGHDEAASWQRARGIHRRIALYAQHAELGAQMLTLAGSDPLTIAWAREHHLAPERWSVDRDLAEVLDACDND